jgi:uncharacterized protein YyaL (SSP411 family)
MKYRFIFQRFAIILTLITASSVQATGRTNIAWRDWTDTLFADAKREKRLVLLDLEAVWCHWCHVMDEQTYADPYVAALIAKGYLAVKVDQDSRPDLANRYEDYGWPATILFDSDGRELAKLSGYIPKERMRATLQTFLDDPTPGPSVTSERRRPNVSASAAGATALTETQRADLAKDHVANYDFEHGSWGTVHKFLQESPIEWTLRRSHDGDAQALRMARQTLDAQLALIDHAWGGAYQYSHGGVWENPHFEKIMSAQATNLRSYALAFALFKEPRYGAAAASVRRYLSNFLTSPSGAFFTSQDADVKQGEHADEYFRLDDAKRRAQGVPKIDKNVYARENGWAIEALALAGATLNEPTWIAGAERAARWIVANRGTRDGGFRHGALRTDPNLYLGDTLAMTRAFLQLYAATGTREWLDKANAGAAFIAVRFAAPEAGPGFVTARSIARAMPGHEPRPQRDENVQIARLANLLFHYTGDHAHRATAAKAMAYLSAAGVIDRRPAAAMLLADDELRRDPTHVTIVGSKADPSARRLFEAARANPETYLRIEFWDDDADGLLPHHDVKYPRLDKAAAFACAAGRCSAPIYDPSRIAETLTRFRDGS